MMKKPLLGLLATLALATAATTAQAQVKFRSEEHTSELQSH